MLYVIIGHDGPDAKTLRARLRESHLDYIAECEARGMVKLAGPLTDGHGSLFLVEAAGREEALEMAELDPYRRGGVFERLEVHPFKQVFPAP